jgi:hypothetical protein
MVYYFWSHEHMDVDRIVPPDGLAVLLKHDLLANLDAIGTRLDKECLRCGEMNLRRTQCCRKAIRAVYRTEVVLGIIGGPNGSSKIQQYRCPDCRGDVRNIGSGGFETATREMRLFDWRVRTYMVGSERKCHVLECQVSFHSMLSVAQMFDSFLCFAPLSHGKHKQTLVCYNILMLHPASRMGNITISQLIPQFLKFGNVARPCPPTCANENFKCRNPLVVQGHGA